MKFRWALVGVLAATVGCSSMHKNKNHEEEEEGDEVKMTMDQVPPAVKATLMQQAGGVPIKTVDKEMSKGKTIYETDVMQGGTNWEIRVAEDGTLISKKVDNEEAEKADKKKEKEEDDEKNEKK